MSVASQLCNRGGWDTSRITWQWQSTGFQLWGIIWCCYSMASVLAGVRCRYDPNFHLLSKNPPEMTSEHQVALARAHRMPAPSNHISRATRQVVPAFLQKLYEFRMLL